MKSFKEVFELTKELNVLFIEDDKNFQEETAEIFENLFKKVDLASNGKSGIKKYIEYRSKYTKHYDIVFTDINMPNIDGVELTKQIYNINEYQPIIVISAHNDANYLLKFVNLGIEQFLVKPLEYDTLLTTIHNTTKKLNKTDKKSTNANMLLEEDYIWNREKSLLCHNKIQVKLTKNETTLIKIFLKNNSKITTLDEISQTISCQKCELMSLSTIKTIISRLRKKISPLEIENIYGLGYRLNA